DSPELPRPVAEPASSMGQTPNPPPLGSAKARFPVILLLPLLLLLGSGAWFGFLHWRERRGDHNQQRFNQQLRADWLLLESALQQGDSLGFSQQARHILQQVLAREWKCPPESVTRHEVRQRQPAGVQELETLFDALDAVHYSAAALEAGDMPQLRDQLNAWLQQQPGISHV
ncbi:MAG: hypothetical protein HC904_07015, partial [Blastochloris sp.]|nr:hypothetical protein [Blastochloris sp.]